MKAFPISLITSEKQVKNHNNTSHHTGEDDYYKNNQKRKTIDQVVSQDGSNMNYTAINGKQCGGLSNLKVRTTIYFNYCTYISEGHKGPPSEMSGPSCSLQH